VGIVIGVVVLLICSYLLGAALQKPTLIKPYLVLFVLAGLAAVGALALGTDVGSAGEWSMLGAKLIALLGCLALCVHLAALVVRRLLDKRRA
jgi:uncharacterized membrane protein YhaH (DUF805 family)